MTDPLAAVLGGAEYPRPTLTADDVRFWPPHAVPALEGAGVLTAADPARAVECDSCGHGHVEPVGVEDTPGRPRRWHILCPTDGRVRVEPDRLRRWAVVPAALGRAVGGGEPDERVAGRVWKLGPARVGGVLRVGWLVAGWRGEAGLVDRVPELVQPTTVVFVPDVLPPAAAWGAAVPPVVVPLADVLTLTAAGLGVNPDALAAHLPAAPLDRPAHADSGKSDPPSGPPADEPVVVTAPRPLVPLPPGTKWEEVKVEVGDHHLVVRAPAGEWRVGYEPAGFADARTGAPGQRWALLRELAKRGGELDGDWVFTKSDRLTRAVSDLRAALRRLTGLTADPFRPTRRTRPYRTRFRLTLARPSDG